MAEQGHKSVFTMLPIGLVRRMTRHIGKGKAHPTKAALIRVAVEQEVDRLEKRAAKSAAPPAAKPKAARRSPAAKPAATKGT